MEESLQVKGADASGLGVPKSFLEWRHFARALSDDWESLLEIQGEKRTRRGPEDQEGLACAREGGASSVKV